MDYRTGLFVALALPAGAAGIVLAAAPAACIPDLPSALADGGALDVVVPVEAGPPRCGDGIVQLPLGEQCDPGASALSGVGANGCSATCKMQCDGGFVWPTNDHCYVAGTETTRFDTASSQCLAFGGHLVTFASEAELDAVVGAIDAGAFWIGFYDGIAKYDTEGTLEPGWQPGCDGCFAHTADTTVALPPAVADAGAVGCVAGSTDLSASWQQVDCMGKTRMTVLCEREPPGRLWQTCEAGDCMPLRVTVGQKRYVLVRQTASSDQAAAACATLGGRLVVLQTRDEREQLWKELGKVPGFTTGAAEFWIGLTATGDDGGWVWADDAGLDAYPPPWAARQPRDGGERAFLYENGGTPPEVDDTLAHAALRTDFLGAYVCEMPVNDE